MRTALTTTLILLTWVGHAQAQAQTQAQAQAAPASVALAATVAPVAPVVLDVLAAPATRCIDVDVHNVRPQQGQLFLAAYGTADSYNKKPMAVARVPAVDAITPVQLCGISGNELAITLYQDIDGDGKMGKNMMGLPTEPWGSTGKPGMFGPSWETGKLMLDGSPVIARLSQ